MTKILDEYLGVISASTLASLKRILESTAEKERTHMSSIQHFDEENNILHLVGYLGFSDSFEKHFRQVRPFDGCSCGRAIGMRNPVFVSDVRMDMAYAPHLALVESEGIRAVKSFPIIDKNNKRLGVISTHFPEPQSSFRTTSPDEYTKELIPILSSLRLPNFII